MALYEQMETRKEEHTDMHRGMACVDRHVVIKLHMCMLICMFMGVLGCA